MKKFSGWIQLILVSLASGFGFSLLVVAFSLINPTMFEQQQIPMSASMYGLAFSVYAFTQGPPQLLVAKAVSKFGPKKILLAGYGAIVVVSFGFARFINSSITFVVIYGFCFGMINAFTSQLAPSTVINNWFFAYRGMAQSIKLGITSAISCAAPFFVTWLIRQTGAGYMIGWYIAGAGAVVAALLTMFVKDSPEQCNQLPDGGSDARKSDNGKKRVLVSTTYKRPVGEDIEYKDAMKMPITWLIIAASSIGLMCMMLNSFNQNMFLVSCISLDTISLALGVAPILNVVFALVIARFLDRIEPGYVLGIIFLLFGINNILVSQGANTILTFTTAILSSLLGAVIFAITPVICSNYFGNKAFPQIQGFSLMVGGLLSSTTGIIVGWLADLTGAYAVSFILYGVLAILAGMICIFVIGRRCSMLYKQQSKVK